MAAVSVKRSIVQSFCGRKKASWPTSIATDGILTVFASQLINVLKGKIGREIGIY